MKKMIIVILTVLQLQACGNNKIRQTEVVVIDNQAGAEQLEPDTITSSVQERTRTVRKNPFTPICSSSASLTYSHKSSSYDNMCGFDSASEDDMDDNGKSRYMKNDDEEDWD